MLRLQRENGFQHAPVPSYRTFLLHALSSASDNLVHDPWTKKFRYGIRPTTADAKPVDNGKSHKIPLVSTAVTDYFVYRN